MSTINIIANLIDRFRPIVMFIRRSDPGGGQGFTALGIASVLALQLHLLGRICGPSVLDPVDDSRGFLAPIHRGFQAVLEEGAQGLLLLHRVGVDALEAAHRQLRDAI